ncbi:MAG: hypothetical protein M5T61_21160 [Acidimicrobiia bacterium]|nr:hypothetical protein [Acidimicrobiia bacterium]
MAPAQGDLHWVSASHAVPAEVRLYDHLFRRPDPGAEGDLFADLNPDSERIVRGGDAGAVARRRRARRNRPVRTARLLHPGHRLPARGVGLQTGHSRSKRHRPRSKQKGCRDCPGATQQPSLPSAL